MQVVERRFILSSELFEGCESLKDDLSDSNNITWGDSQHCLVWVSRIITELGITPEGDDTPEISTLRKNVDEAEKLLGIGPEDDFLVDLEK